MASRMVLGEKPMVLTVSARGGVRWARRADLRNQCIGDQMRGRRFGSRFEAAQAFRQASDYCTPLTRGRSVAQASRAGQQQFAQF